MELRGSLVTIGVEELVGVLMHGNCFSFIGSLLFFCNCQFHKLVTNLSHDPSVRQRSRLLLGVLGESGEVILCLLVLPRQD